MEIISLLINAFLYRLDGVGKGDKFLPILPFPKWGGVNYARYAIGAVIAVYTGFWLFLLTYAIAVSIPYGEKSPLRMLPLTDRHCWFITGFAFGLASLSWGNAVFSGCLFLFLMEWSNYGLPMDIPKLDHAWVEFIFGGLGTLIHILR